MRLSTGFILSLLGVTSQFARGFSLRPFNPTTTNPFNTLSATKGDNNPKLGINNGSLSVVPGNAIIMRGGSKFSAASVRSGGGDESMSAARKIANTAASLWAAGGVVMILGKSIKRILPIALEPFDGISKPLSTFQLGSYIAMCMWFAYVEGFKGFQKKIFALGVARAQTLQPFEKGSPIHHTLFGPFYAMGLFHATKKRKIVSWSVSIGVGLIVAAVKRFPYPWRNIVDAGVIVGLSWGSLSIAIEWFKAIVLGIETKMDPALPTSNE